MPNKFRASLPIENILAKASGNKLKVDLLAAAIGTELPFVSESGDPIVDEESIPVTFTATEPALRQAVKKFQNGIFNANHTEQKIGDISHAYFLNGFAVKGEICCPNWSNKIKNDEYTGVSVEGSVEGDLTHPDTATINIFAVAFLDENDGACPKDLCHVKSFDFAAKSSAGNLGKIENKVGDITAVTAISTDTLTIDTAIMNPVGDEMSFEAAWSPNYDGYWSYIEDENGKISKTKARQIFLKMTGTGENRGDWHYPIAKMSNGKPVPSEEGLKAAHSRAAQQKDSEVLKKLPGKFKQAGLPVPEGLKGNKVKLQASVDDKGKRFSAKLIDEEDEVVQEKEIFVIDITTDATTVGSLPNSNLEVDKMAEEVKNVKAEEVSQVETTAASPTQAELVVTPESTPTSEPVLSTDTNDGTAELSAPVQTELSELAPQAGIPVEEFEQMKAAVAKMSDLETKLQQIMTENEDLKKFKMDSQIHDLQRSYPPGLWDGEVEIKKTVDGKEVTEKVPKKMLFYQEFLKDPASFALKYEGDRLKFAAANQTGKLQGSAVEAAETEETLKNRKRREAKDAFYARTGGAPSFKR